MNHSPQSGLAEIYSRQGYVVFDYLSKEQFENLRVFATDWVYGLLERHHPGIKCRHLSLETYHEWSPQLGIAHGEIFRAKNRHIVPPRYIQQTLFNSKLSDALKALDVKEPRLWDEGLGWLAFRFIRPGVGDGYPTSRKAWGPAKTVVSAYIPIVGFEPEQTIAFVDGSHIKDYPHYLPKETKYRHDEYRLSPEVTDLSFTRPRINPCQALLFHPKVLHTEEIAAGAKTRFSLEFRLDPSLDAS